MRRVVEALTRRRWLAVGVALAVALVVGSFATRLSIDNSLSAWFVDDDPALLSYQAFLKEFGSDEVVVILIQGEAPILTQDRLDRLTSLTGRLQEIDGVARVWSLANLAVPQPDPGGVTFAPLLTQPVGADAVARAQAVLDHSSVGGRLVGHDNRSLAVYAWLYADPKVEQQRGRILQDIGAAAAASLGPGETAHLGGFGVVYDALNRATLSEGALFIGLSYVVVAVALFVVTGRLLWTVLALVVVTLADLVLFGAMGLLGRSINSVTMALPPLVMVLGVAHILHMTTHIEDPEVSAKHKGLLAVVLAAVAVPCLLNALTTSAGFLSLTTASMAVTRDYGLFAAIGVLAAFAFALVGVSALLDRAQPQRPGRVKAALTQVSVHAVAFSLRHRGKMVLAAAAVALAAVWGVFQIEVDTHTLDFLPANDPALADHDAIEANLGPYFPLEILLKAPQAGAWRSARFLAALTEAQRRLEALPQVGTTTSVADVVRDLYGGLTGEQVDPSWSPPDDEAVALLVNIASGSEQTGYDALISDDERTLRLTASVPLASAKALIALTQQAVAVVADSIGGLATVTASGYLPLYGQIVDHLVRDQMTSFAIAFLVVFLLVGLVLRSWRYTLIAIPPNLLPVLIVMGVMGVAGIRLDLATVTIAAVVLGIVVDDTLHLLYGLKQRLSEGQGLDAAFEDVARTAGLAVTSTSLVFVLGFGVIALASLKSVAYVGLLTAVAVGAALVVDLLLLPAIASYGLKRRS